LIKRKSWNTAAGKQCSLWVVARRNWAMDVHATALCIRTGPPHTRRAIGRTGAAITYHVDIALLAGLAQESAAPLSRPDIEKIGMGMTRQNRQDVLSVDDRARPSWRLAQRSAP
jgi:hypothetical protein